MKIVRIFTVVVPLLVWPLAPAAQDWQSGSKEESWLDANFVACDGMGMTASGSIEVRVGYQRRANVIRVVDWQLRTRYFHPHSASARLTWEKATDGTGSMNLEPAWFPTIAPNDGSGYLFLARNGNQPGSQGQTPFEMKADTEIGISVGTLFPQFGGNCVATFSAKLKLP